MACPLCGSANEKGRSADPFDPANPVFRIECLRCGTFDISDLDRRDQEATRGRELIQGGELSFPLDQLHLVSGHLREATLLGHDPVRITAEIAANIVRGAPQGVPARIDRLLLNLSRMSEFVGAYLEGDALHDYPLGYCSGAQEFEFFLHYLHSAGLVTGELFGGPQYNVTLTVAGWARVQELERPTTETRQCFVAMSFDPALAGMFERGIAPAVEEAGYRPLVLSREEHADRVDERIVLELNRSRFVVADFTGQRQSVYFEAGYALGRGIPVIWTCRADEEEALHFDTRQYNYIFWKTEEELRERLYTRIKTMLG